MFVINRRGEQEPCKFDKISERIASLAWGLSEAYCDPVRDMRRQRSGRARLRRDARPLRVLIQHRVVAARGARTALRAPRARWAVGGNETRR
jgi:hypothetical protein